MSEFYELFLAAFRYTTEKMGHGTQARVAEYTGKTARHINDILGGRRRAGQLLQSRISDFFGYKYEDFLKLGRSLLEGEGSDRPPLEPALRKRRMEAEAPQEEKQEAPSRPKVIRDSELLNLVAKVLKNSEDIQEELAVLRRNNLEMKEKITRMEKEIAALKKHMDEEGELKVANGE